VLLAEDNEVNRKLAVRLLEKRGHHVDVAFNGREALIALRNSHYDLVLMDVQMPEMGGIEATAALRASELESGRHTPVVAMTALVMKGDRERCLAVGMDGYLSKPIHTQELDDVLEKFISIKRKIDPEQKAHPNAPIEVGTETIDENVLLFRLGGDREFLAELVTLFREDCPSMMIRIRTALRQHDAAEVIRVAHSLRGPLANFSASSAAALAAKVEYAAAAGDLNTANAAFSSFEPELLRAIDALSAICEERVP